MTLNQKCAVLVTLESRMENIKRQLERETDDYTRECLVETLGELIGGYMCIELIQPTDLYDETDPCRDSDYSDRDDPCKSSDYGESLEYEDHEVNGEG